MIYYKIIWNLQNTLFRSFTKLIINDAKMLPRKISETGIEREEYFLYAFIKAKCSPYFSKLDFYLTDPTVSYTKFKLVSDV